MASILPCKSKGDNVVLVSYGREFLISHPLLHAGIHLVEGVIVLLNRADDISK